MRHWVGAYRHRRLPLRPRAARSARRPAASRATRRSSRRSRAIRMLKDLILIAEPGTSARAATARRFPGRLARMERPLSRRCPPLLARRSRRCSAPLATRLAGSSDIFRRRGRSPAASVNFVAAHDGFTLGDLVSYRAQAQRGQRRGQPRRPRREFSWNHGVEGAPTSRRSTRRAGAMSARCSPRSSSRAARRC